ncbi:MAG: TnpV protein [Lachnospiraceae bacterium]|nr:TnpV protein [Lachnospiraceae bacterium]MDE7178268.1 TnpV protein [Lachnospiraceae bacterium]
MTDITYRAEGDYLIPELILDGDGYKGCPKEEIGRYGELRESYLREHQHGTYTAMLLMGSLTTHLQEIDRQAEEEMECLLRKMMERQGIDEALKASDQMAWVRKVNALRAMAEEVVLQEIVYQ